MAQQGKCPICNRRWVWRRPLRLKVQDMHCPKCDGRLKATHWGLLWPTYSAETGQLLDRDTEQKIKGYNNNQTK